MIQTSGLRACPFCGGEPEMVRFTDEEGDPCAAVQCKQCGAGGCKHVAIMDDARPAAASAWNRRATSPELDRLRALEAAVMGAPVVSFSPAGVIETRVPSEVIGQRVRLVPVESLPTATGGGDE